MKVYQKSYENMDDVNLDGLNFNPDIILLFVSPDFSFPEKFISKLKEQVDQSLIIGCSTSGEILDISVSDQSVSLTAIKLEKSTYKLASVNIKECLDSVEVGKNISEQLQDEDLRHILVLSDGLNVNGADLVTGLTESKNKSVTVTGGLAGDGPNFNRTFVIDNGVVKDHVAIGLGLYGKDLKIGYGSKGGWDSFGIERKVTSSKNNVLFELDGEPALALYKSFLGSKADELPGSGLLFPLSMRVEEGELPLVRTILAVDESDQSLTFAGNIPEGSYVRLMKANVDRLITGAEESALTTAGILKEDAELAILISCVGRRLVLKQLVEEELEAVRDVLGDKPAMTGFYSYGELAPFGEFMSCQLHNQTMSITTLSE